MKPQIQTQSQDSQAQGFPVNYSEEQLQHDILILYVLQARLMGMMATEELSKQLPWQILGIDKWEYDADDSDPDLCFKALNLTYDLVKETRFARTIQTMYQYAYFGRIDLSEETLCHENHVTWIGYIIMDMNNSYYLAEWDYIGGEGIECAKRCLNLALLTNARKILEGQENLFSFSGKDSEDSTTDEEGLTIKQLAFLSGMEEMSVRAAANPKRANPLETFKSDNCSTLISLEAAKKWLIEKKRYVPITRFYGRGDSDITARRYTTIEQLVDAMNVRLYFRLSRDNLTNELRRSLENLQICNASITESTAVVQIVFELLKLDDPNQIEELAELLGVSHDLLKLRIQETTLLDSLADVERELKAVQEK